MKCWPSRLIVILLLFAFVASGRAASAWTQLKLGMTPGQAVATVGEPLLRSAGNGFQIWTYDDRAELVFYGPLVGWTAPRRSGETVRSHDVWSAAAPTGATPLTLPRPPVAKVAAMPASAVGSAVPGYRRRY